MLYFKNTDFTSEGISLFLATNLESAYHLHPLSLSLSISEREINALARSVRLGVSAIRFDDRSCIMGFIRFMGWELLITSDAYRLGWARRTRPEWFSSETGFYFLTTIF